MSTTAPADAPTITTSPMIARTLAKVSVGAAVTTAAAIAIAGFTDPGYSARSEAISALASVESKSASIMIFGFVTMALTALSAGTALFLALKGKAARTASVFVIIGGVLTLVAGFTRQSCSTLQQSCLDRETAGTVSGAHVTHNLVSLVLFVLLVAAGFLLAAGLKRSVAHRHLSLRVRIAATATLAFMVWFGSGFYGTNGGLVESAFILLAFGTPAYVATRVAGPETRSA
jgi:hypothetical membrane protein